MASSHPKKEPLEKLSPDLDAPPVQTSPKPLAQAPSGRPYLLYKPSSGKKVKMLGALLPDGYELRSDPEYPFICPVKSCGSLFSTLQGVDIHFWRSHEAEMFNDNLDGTLSPVGRRTGEGKLPAIVVSQGSLVPEDMEMREASLPLKSSPTLSTPQDAPQVPQMLPSSSSHEVTLGTVSQLMSIPRSPTLTADEPNRGLTLWERMAPFLGHQDISSFEKSGPTYQLLQLPQRREPATEPQIRHEQNGPNMDGASIPNTRRSSRIKTLPNRSTVEPATPTPSLAKKRKLEPQSSGKGTTASSGGSKNNSSRRRFSRREIHMGSQTSSVSSSSVPNQTMPPSPSSPTYSFHNTFQLEGWELAPGKIRSGKHNIAFSTTFLRSNNPITIHPAMAFHVVVVSAGMSHRVEASPNKIRLVSVAAGKIHAKISGEEEFVVSTNGAVKVLADVVCVLHNPFAVDATLHVCALHQEQQS
ncbi:hypothetical protein SLS62_001155 [Diatrype stigma]|uniref:C2H2-type domain-containing protein n=1 Tax=Diatrype stigma TaxID=117547 RepID=A0AAN9UW98_9PEZI